MAKAKKADLEYRYYRMPENMYVFALLGEAWVRHYGKDDKGEDIRKLHFHNFLEIGYCKDGMGEMILADKTYKYAAGHFTVIPRKYPHNTKSREGKTSSWEYLFIDTEGFLKHFCGDALKMKKMEQALALIEGSALFLQEKREPELAENIRRLLDIFRLKPAFFEEEAHGMLLALLMKLAGRAQEKAEGKLRESTSSGLSDTLDRAMDYVEKHYHRDMRVSELAAHLYISETHLRRIFGQYMNIGVLEYLNLVRIHEACKYLQKTGDSIEDIAVRCGFTTVSTFHRNFRRFMGVAPQDWRKRPQNYEQGLLRYRISVLEGWR